MGKMNEVLQEYEVVAIDSNCFIYYLEGGMWAEELKENLFLPLEQGSFRAITSVLTVTEIGEHQ